MRQKSKDIVVYIIVFLLTINYGCSILRHAQRRKIEKRYTTVWLKSVNIYQCNNERRIGNIDLRYIKDSVLLVVLRNNMGLEGGRIYFYKDSLFLFNRINRTYYCGKNFYFSNIQTNKKQFNFVNSVFLQEGKIKKIFEVPGQYKANKIYIYIKSFEKTKTNIIIPVNFVLKYRIKESQNCFKAVVKDFVVNKYISVRKINFQGKYRKKTELSEVL